MYNRTAMVVMHMSFWLLCIAIVVALAMLGCAFISGDEKPTIAKLPADTVVLKGVDIYLFGEKSVKDVIVNRDKHIIVVGKERIPYDGPDEIIDGMLAAQIKRRRPMLYLYRYQ